MKAKALKILMRIKNVPLYVLVSGLILEAILIFFFGKVVDRHPRFLSVYNYALAVNSLIVVLGIIFLPASESNTEKYKRIRRNRNSLQTRIFGRYYSVRHLFFLILGVLCMLYCIISLSFHEIEKFNKIFRICTFAFIFVYLLVYNVLSIIFSKPKKDDSNYDIKGEEEIGMYLIGLLLVGVIALIIGGIIWTGKGIIWLTQYPIVIFGMVVLCMYLLRRNTSKKVK